MSQFVACIFQFHHECIRKCVESSKPISAVLCKYATLLCNSLVYFVQVALRLRSTTASISIVAGFQASSDRNARNEVNGNVVKEVDKNE